ncbi:hypothetical protein SSAG_01648 [Streptomyces sp. Mg1]|nr:hypothetical protein SSAG_01648 [Streptomyces sp. Mg1]
MPMRDSHRGEAERLLERAVGKKKKKKKKTGAPADREALLARGREALDGLATSAGGKHKT